MPISTDLSVSPYFDDYNENNDFYKVLFRPGVAVQTRELNQLQSILQKQIERFGDNIFKRGTIVDGCDITYHTSLQYVKLKDNQVDGAPLNVNQLIGYYLKDSANVSPLVATVQNVIDGYESRSPDLKTVYVTYTNSGYANVAGISTERQQFVANDVLTVYKPSNPIESIAVTNASAGFSNSDSVVILSSIAIQNSTGGATIPAPFQVGDEISTATANALVVAVDTTSNTQATILRIKPLSNDLHAANTSKWAFYVDDNIEATSRTTSRIVGIVGTGAAAVLRTGTINKELSSITVTQKGSGYYVLPTVSVQSTGASTTQITNAVLTPQTYLTTIQIANSTFTPVGTGYGITVGKGVIYQKGYFSRVNEHMTIVEKYSNTGFDKAVGFNTAESIINSNQDTSLLDNATGQPNATAPGANRLKLTPTLVVKTKAEADADTDFFSVVEFSQGNPYKQNQQTQYSIIGNEIARRSYDESGNFVRDPFILNTTYANSISNEATSFNISIDPGLGYIGGRRVETYQPYIASVDKGIDTFIANNANVSLNYGNYIRVNELGGIFQFNTGDIVSLYSSPSDFISGGNAGTTPSSGSLGTELGTARIRSLVLESGTPGTSSAVYRLYLFDINLATARNFNLVRSIFYNGAYKGVCDAVLEGGNAVLKDSNLSSLLYYAGRPAVKSGNNFSYIYRTINTANSYQVNAAGKIVISATGNETFPYTAGAALSSAQEQDLLIIPMANVQYAANITGTVTTTTNSTVTGSGTSFTSVFEAGDYIKIANSSASIIRQIASVDSDTSLTLTNNATAFTGVNAVMYFPQYVPVPLRGSRSANLDANANTLTINIGAAVNVATNVTVGYNVRSSNTTPVTKTVNRDVYVRLQLSNNATSNTGPWVLGVPDVFHLKGVYLGSNATFDASTGTDITNEFYADHNQNENFYGYSYLYRKSNANTALTTSNYLLVKFDYFTYSGEGLKAPGSGGTYTINDTINLASSSSSINTLEIPEVYGTKGDYYDLRDQFDFRPIVTANVTPNATATSAPINPTEKTATTKFGTSDKKFPAPDSNMTGIIEYYQGRYDRVTIDQNGEFVVMRGTPDSTEPPSAPSDALTINVLAIPPYPSHPKRLSADTVAFFDNKMANEIYTNKRMDYYRVAAPVNAAQRSVLQPRGYTMVDIGALERRIAALEYYTLFTLVETMTQKKVIPSSANSAIDRFKFGFFVDGFNNYNYADTSNPEYNASIVDGYLSPKADEINIPIEPPGGGGGDPTTLPFIEKVFISQPDATNGPVVAPVVDPVTPPPVVNIDTGTITITPVVANTTQTVTKTIDVIQSQKNTLHSDNGYYYDEFFFTFSQSAGAAEFYINSQDNNIGVIIFQSKTQGGPWTTQVRNSGTDALPITSSDVTTKYLSPLNDYKPIEHQGSLDTKSYYFTGTSRWNEDQLKMLWTHNPDNGQYYMIRVYKGDHHSGFLGGGGGNAGHYGFKLFYPADVTETVNDPANGWSPTINFPLGIYFGGFDATFGITLNPIAFDFSNLNPALPGINPSDPGVISNEQLFNVKITGLRANTAHKFYLEGVDKSANCKQTGKVLGEGLVTDANGELEFVFYYYPVIETTNVTTEAAAVTEMVAATKTVKVVNTDNTSRAESTLQVKNYIKKVFTAPPVPAVVVPAPVVEEVVSPGPGSSGALMGPAIGGSSLHNGWGGGRVNMV